MKIGVISDSHKNEENITLVFKYLVEEKKVPIIIHLGDDFDDVELLPEHPVKIIRVPGVFSPYYQDPNIPNRLIEEFEGWKVLVTHTLIAHHNDLPQDLVPEEVIQNREVQVVFYGHTHIPCLEQKEDIFYVNPGHLQSHDKKGYDPSYGLIEFKKDKIRAHIFDLYKNKPILYSEFSRRRSNL